MFANVSPNLLSQNLPEYLPAPLIPTPSTLGMSKPAMVNWGGNTRVSKKLIPKKGKEKEISLKRGNLGVIVNQGDELEIAPLA